LAELQVKAKFAGKKASDEVEGLKFEVKWETSKGAFGVKVAEEDVRVEEGSLDVVS
jgi:mediator of RNA polymerase II transcription subunit 14